MSNAAQTDHHQATIRKIQWQILPFLVLLYIIAFIDRSNIGFAALKMNSDLGITSTQFGVAAGLFTVGYFLFEVPSNILMYRYGARKWIARILFTWGAVAACTGLVQSYVQLAVIRTILGIAEAGFFPCVLLYLTYWFPERQRARVVALFMIALPIATLIAGPLSGIILDHVHWNGIASWRWVFILEGLPAVLFGFLALRILVDHPRDAKWLSEEEKTWLVGVLEAEAAAKVKEHGDVSFWRSLSGARIWMLAFIYYAKSVAVYVLAFYSPQIVKGLGQELSSTAVGFVNGLPYAVATVVMVWWARRSDRTGERRWHVALPLLVAGAALVLMALSAGNIWVSVALLVVITAAIYAPYGPFWAMPSLFLTGSSAAVGLAAINSIANLGGFVGPVAFGALKDSTGSIYAGLAFVSLTLVAAGILVVRLRFVKEAEQRLRAKLKPAMAG
ncbi:MFS transporter [Caballeronia sp. LP006]|uniref:MFS transporter n=1 Tax=Caballeronia sp. LP006 TaxID=3038552 RepID=UPI002858576F|nr:MFS transporter [Caballeronia sp. LP006]MDR5826332.1 MFS transporter [Caballeronia sp. LP006]